MMFLQFFIWGSWFVTMGSYLAANLGASGAESALAYSTQSWGAIGAPFIIGLIADRYVNAERLLGAIHLLGAALMFVLARARNFADFYPYLLGYMLLYMPTLALVNAIAFRKLAEPARQFSRIRVWGTAGWIAAGVLISYLFAWDAPQARAAGMLRETFSMSAVASLLLGVYSFTLPATVPATKTGRTAALSERLGLDALALLRNRNFLTFVLASIGICIPLAFYYQHANQFLTEIQVANATGKQTIGQMSEVLFMLLIPWFLRRGIKATLLVGMLAWAVRYVCFAWGSAHGLAFLLLVGIALHGACYDFFFVAGQIYTDAKADGPHRGAAQGLITLATYGVGMLIGFWAAGRITDSYARGGVHEWPAIWSYPAGFAALIFVLFALVFRGEPHLRARPTANPAGNSRRPWR